MSETNHGNKKYISDSIWNLGSFGLQALAGAVLNFSIISLSTPAALGVFNQSYAVFAVLGQLFALGQHDYIQKSIVHAAPEKHSHLVTNSFCLAALSGLTGCLVLLAVSQFVGKIFNSSDVEGSLFFVSFALIPFAMNKVLLAAMNGSQRFKPFAIGSSLRAILVVAATLIIVISGFPLYLIGLSFLISEILVLVYCVSQCRPLLKLSFGKLIKGDHLNFGLKAVPYSLLVETFTRIDVLILAYFVSDSLVGIYSFAAFFFEGIFQISYLFRLINNPLVADALSKKDFQQLKSSSIRSCLTSGGLTTTVSILTIALYPWFVVDILNSDISQNYQVLKILLFGLCLHSFWAPLDNLLMQSGQPGKQSIYMSLLSVINIGLNIFLIPRYGLEGAAFATAASFVLTIPLHLYLAKKFIKFSS